MEKKQETKPLMKDSNFLLCIEAMLSPLRALLMAKHEELATYDMVMEELHTRQQIALQNELFERN